MSRLAIVISDGWGVDLITWVDNVEAMRAVHVLVRNVDNVIGVQVRDTRQVDTKLVLEDYSK